MQVANAQYLEGLLSSIGRRGIDSGRGTLNVVLVRATVSATGERYDYELGLTDHAQVG